MIKDDIQPDYWELVNSDSGYLELVFYNSKGSILMTLNLEGENANEILGLVNEEIIINTNQAEAWSLRVPENNKEAIVLTTTKGNKIASNLTLDKAAAQKIVETLERFQGIKRKNIIGINKSNSFLFSIIIFLSIVLIGGMVAGLTIYQQFSTQIQSLQQISNSIG